MNGISYLAMFLEPVKPSLNDPAVSEIMINGPENIYIEKGGKVVKIDSRFPGEPALQAAANNIAKSVGRVLNDEYPRLDARLPDGSRVHIVIPPLRNGCFHPQIPDRFPFPGKSGEMAEHFAGNA